MDCLFRYAIWAGNFWAKKKVKKLTKLRIVEMKSTAAYVCICISQIYNLLISVINLNLLVRHDV